MKTSHRIIHPIASFAQGLCFWSAATVTIAFLPLLTQSLHMTAAHTALFLSGTAMGRMLFQPLAGFLVRPQHAISYHRLSAILLAFASYLLYLLVEQGSPSFEIVGIRVCEGACVSLFTVSWRSALNNWADSDIFDRLNERYVISQNAGRLLGPVIGGWLITRYGLSSMYIGSTALYLGCLLFGYIERISIRFVAAKHATGKRSLNGKLALTGPIRDLVVIHHVEIFCLGLWLASWPSFAVSIRGFTPSSLGASFTVAAAGGLLAPLLRRWMSSRSVRFRLICALSLLALQPIAVLLDPVPQLALWPLFAVAGVGSTLYFMAFHRAISQHCSPETIPKIYGVLGASTYLAQAAGQFVTPFLQYQLGPSAPISIDGCLLMALVTGMAFGPYARIDDGNALNGER